MNESLLAPFKKEEIERAISEMFPTKALGPDGFPELFYQRYWNIVGSNTINDYLDILNMKGCIKN